MQEKLSLLYCLCIVVEFVYCGDTARIWIIIFPQKPGRGGKGRNAFHVSSETKDSNSYNEKPSDTFTNRLSNSYNERGGDSYMKLGSGDSRSRDFSSKNRVDEELHDFDTRPWFENNSDHATYRKTDSITKTDKVSSVLCIPLKPSLKQVLPFNVLLSILIVDHCCIVAISHTSQRVVFSTS